MNETRAQFMDHLSYAPQHAGTVSSIRKGEVVQAVELGHERFRVEVDHGDGFVSSYEGLTELDVKTGDRIERGEALGHFEGIQDAHAQGLKIRVSHRERAIDPVRLWTSN